MEAVPAAVRIRSFILKLLITVVLSGFIWLTACDTEDNPAIQRAEKVPQSSETKEGVKKAQTECKVCDFDFASYTGELRKAEIEGLLLALNDEYRALATYRQINRDFNDPRPFVNIENAEARHIERLESIFAAYKLAVPNNEWLGSAPRFQSAADGCRAGVDAEIANRDLYSKLLKTTDREDILTIYRALQSASEDNHQPAFERCASGGRGR